MSVLVAGTAMCASAAPASAAAKPVVLHADVDAWQVALQDGRGSGDLYGNRTIVAKSAPEAFTPDVFTLAGTPKAAPLSGAAEYQIVMLGNPTGYWIKARMYYKSAYRAQCDIYSGAPSAGGKLADSSPFTCSSRLGDSTPTDIRFSFSVGLNRDAEASGAISPTGAVSLEKGTYNAFKLPYSKRSAESVPSGGTASFDTVLRKGDENPYENQARNEFAYQIYDNGVPTDYWVAGLSTNHRGGVFNGDSRCGIYDSNPLANHGELDQSVPLSSSPYTCTGDGSFKSGPHEDGRVHYFAQFTVRKG